MNYKKTTFLSILFILLLGGAVFLQDRLTTRWLQKVLHQKVQEHFGAELAYESMDKDSQGWIMRHPKLHVGKITYSAESVTIKHHFFADEIELHIPHGHMQISGQDLPLRLCVEGRWERKTDAFCGIASIFEKDKKLLQLHSLEDGIEIQFRDLECLLASELLNTFHHTLHAWQIDKGIIQGSIFLDKTLAPKKGTLSLIDLSCSHSGRFLFVDFPQIDLEFNTEKTNCHCSQKGRLKQTTNNGLILWQVNELLGDIRIQQELVQFELNGLFEGCHFSCPFHLAGETRHELEKIQFSLSNLYLRHNALSNGALLLNELSGQLAIHPFGIVIEDCELFCNEVYFSGEASLLYPHLIGEPHLFMLQARAIDGKLSQLNGIFKEPLFLDQWFDGQLSMRNEGLLFTYAFVPELPSCDVNQHTELRLSLSEGTWKHQCSGIDLKDLSFDFDYNDRTGKCEITNIQALAFLGPAKHAEEYLIGGDYFRYDPADHQIVSFDFWIGDYQADLMRLVGKTERCSNNPEHIQIILDNTRTHIAGVVPQKFECQFQDAPSVINSMQFTCEFDFGAFLGGLKRFNRTGLLFLSKNIIHEISSVSDAKGTFNLALAYDQATAEFAYSLIGKEIQLGGYSFNECFLNGVKKGSTWSIEQCKLDQISFSSEFILTPENLELKFFGLGIENSLLLGLEGHFDLSECRFFGKVKHFVMQLQMFKHFSGLNQWPLQYLNNAKLSGIGTLLVEKRHAKQPWDLKGELEFSLEGMPLLPREGLLNFSISNKNQQLKLTFKENAELKEENSHLKSLSLKKEHKQLQALFECNLYHRPCTAQLDIALGEKIGTFLLKDDYLNSLQGHWSYVPEEELGFQVRDLDGTFANCKAALQSKGTNELVGSVELDLQKPSIFYSDEIYHQFSQSKIAGKITLDGNWEILPLDGLQVRYKGPIEGQNLQIQDCVIKKLRLEHCQGLVNDSGSWQGEGSAHLVIGLEKNLPLPFLEVSQKILSELGLESKRSTLSGEIAYQISNRQVHLIKLKEFYSVGKLAKFSLLKQSRAFIDFNGNLELMVHVKPNHLLLKSADDAVLHLSGTILHPELSIESH